MSGLGAPFPAAVAFPLPPSPPLSADTGLTPTGALNAGGVG